jgi:hypothetical protein
MKVLRAIRAEIRYRIDLLWAAVDLVVESLTLEWARVAY